MRVVIAGVLAALDGVEENLTDPPTSPVKYPDQLVCGVIVAVVSYAVFEWVGAAYYLLAGVLVGNLWEALSRMRLLKAKFST